MLALRSFYRNTSRPIGRFFKYLSLIRYWKLALMTHYNDGRESALLEHLKALPSDKTSTPSAILSAIDAYSNQTESTFLMNIGPEKGAVIRDVIAKEKPKVMVEMGGYVGYSAITFASEVLKHADGREGVKYYSLELSEQFAGIMKETIGMAGLGDSVEVLVGSSASSLPRLKSEFGVEKIDVLFIDHMSEHYVPDLKVAEQLGLVQPGTVLVADNVIMPGAPDYLDYVRGKTSDGRNKYDTRIERSFIHVAGRKIEDGVEISKCVGPSKL